MLKILSDTMSTKINLSTDLVLCISPFDYEFKIWDPNPDVLCSVCGKSKKWKECWVRRTIDKITPKSKIEEYSWTSSTISTYYGSRPHDSYVSGCKKEVIMCSESCRVIEEL